MKNKPTACVCEIPNMCGGEGNRRCGYCHTCLKAVENCRVSSYHQVIRQDAFGAVLPRFNREEQSAVETVQNSEQKKWQDRAMNQIADNQEFSYPKPVYNPQPAGSEWVEDLKIVFYKEFDKDGFIAVDTTFENIKAFVERRIAAAEARGAEREAGRKREFAENMVRGAMHELNQPDPLAKVRAVKILSDYLWQATDQTDSR